MSQTDLLKEIAHRYLTECGGRPTSDEIAAWAMEQGIWPPASPSEAARERAACLERAMREDLVTDLQGRQVRAKHEVKLNEEGRPVDRWVDVRTASHRFMEISFQQRRHRILMECRRLKADLESFSQARAVESPIELSFDFSNELDS